MDYVRAFENARWNTMTFPQLKNFTTELNLYGAVVDGRTKGDLVKSVHTFLSIVAFTSPSKPYNSAAAVDHMASPALLKDTASDPDHQQIGVLL